MLNLVNEKVMHKVFGEGEVLSHENNIVEVAFTNENKKFVYPDAFEQHLVMTNKTASEEVQEIVDTQNQQRLDEENYKEEQRLLEREQQKLRLEYDKMTNNHKLHAESQMVYWCTPEEREKSLSNWSIFTGLIKSGAKKNQPNNANRLHRNSAVLLTERNEGDLEENRRILGMYMVGERFSGKLCKDGMIYAHPTHRITLTEEESKQIPFWNYYSNKKTPYKIAWNTGKYRYFENYWMAQILRDIVAIKTDEEEKQQAQSFLDYFCQMNQINLRSLPMPNGTLIADIS